MAWLATLTHSRQPTVQGPNYTLARTDLAKSGYNANNKLTVNLWYETTGHYPQSADQAQVLKKDLEASGVITVNLHGLDWPTMGSDRHAGSMAMFIMGWYPDFIDPYDYTYSIPPVIRQLLAA